MWCQSPRWTSAYKHKGRQLAGHRLTNTRGDNSLNIGLQTLGETTHWTSAYKHKGRQLAGHQLTNTRGDNSLDIGLQTQGETTRWTSAYKHKGRQLAGHRLTNTRGDNSLDIGLQTLGETTHWTSAYKHKGRQLTGHRLTNTRGDNSLDIGLQTQGETTRRASAYKHKGFLLLLLIPIITFYDVGSHIRQYIKLLISSSFPSRHSTSIVVGSVQSSVDSISSYSKDSANIVKLCICAYIHIVRAVNQKISLFTAHFEESATLG